MNTEILKQITETESGHPLKNLNYKKFDNIISGQIKCPLYSKPHLYDGWVTIQWNVKGFPIRKYKGMNEYKINLEIQK
jgi:hypothetical protein